jgi:hypothetical protein
MERHFNNDFERFLKQNADQYRLYPSTKPWKGIYSHFHGKRRWFGLGAILLLLTGSLITVLIINSPKQKPVAQTIVPAANPPEQKAFVPSLSSISSIAGSSIINSTQIPGPRMGSLSIASVSPENNYPIINYSVIRDQIGLNSLSQSQTNVQPELLTPLFISLTDELTDQNSYIQALEQQRVAATLQQRNFVTDKFDWTIESVLNNYKKRNRIGLQFNFTPTISYRKLSENKDYMRSAAAQNNTAYSPLYNINSAVTHKPDMGVELGLTAKYALNATFRVKAGLQFNVNRYDIKAFDYPIEVATIALDGGGSRVDSLHTISTYRNFNGNNPSWLQNLYFQVSMPVGVEAKIVGDDKVEFGIAGTIQPTYVLGDRAYLLTTDYKNYAEVPWLIRHWNVNTAFETFVSYSTGKLKWQVGPQVRYQLLSSFVKKYPVKENLFDFGLKVGISLNTP